MLQSLYNSLLFTIIIFSPCLSAQTQNNGNITDGSSITAAENSIPWLSPSGDFALGFQQLQNSTDSFILCIWFNRIPDRTIVWFESNTYPIDRGCTLQLTAQDGLVLRDSSNRIFWSPGDYTKKTAYGFMNDSGNFIVWGRDSTRLWESFREPADTILPTQTLEINDMLFSKKSASNFDAGRFYARMLESGSFVLGVRRATSYTQFVDDEYYDSQTSDRNASNSGYQLVLDKKGTISITRMNGHNTSLSKLSNPSPSENYYYRATLDFDGVFTQYIHPRNFSGNPGWTAVNSWPDNICVDIVGEVGPGACGFNSVCTVQNKRPVCNCTQGFSLADPNNPYGDCVPMLVSSCAVGDNSSSFDLLAIPDTDWPRGNYDKIDPSSEEDCKNSCLNDCLCGAATYQPNFCLKKTLPLSNGRVDKNLGVTAFLKFRRGDAPSPIPDQAPSPIPDQPTPNQKRRGRKSVTVVGSVLLGSSGFVLFTVVACIGFFLIYKNKRAPLLNSAHKMLGANLHCFTYKELVQATNGFKEELGRGAFGIVYKGEIPDGGAESIVAVKKLNRVSDDSEKEFRAEVNAIGQTHHKNLVCLLGYCDEGTNRLLVYEFMCNGTLASFVFGDTKPSWSQRCLMALGVASGLTYLHEECSTQIIHCDIKPQNILIDEHYYARISDFGLAKLLRMDQTRTMTNIRGTKGYVAPEWFRNTQITAKVDVYSFGVMLLEIISCRKNIENTEKFDDEESPILSDRVWDCFRERKLDSLVHDDMEALNDRTRLERFVMVGLWCIQEDASLRPSMRKVSQMLEGVVEVALPPCPSTFR